MAFLTDKVRSAHDRQKQSLIEEAGKAGAQVVEILELGDEQQATNAIWGGMLKAMVGGRMQVDTVMILRLSTNGWPHVYAQPFSGFNALPGEHHGFLDGCLAAPAILREELRRRDCPWDLAAGPEVARQLGASPQVREAVRSLVWEWAAGTTKVTLDWGIQLRSVGNGTTHVVMQAGRYGGFTTYEVGFAQWMKVLRAIHSCLAGWAPPAQYFPVPSRYGPMCGTNEPVPDFAPPTPMPVAAQASASPVAVSVDYVATVQQALAHLTGNKVWVGEGTIPPKKLERLRAALPPELASSPIVAAIDITLMGSAKDAIVVTPTHLAHQEIGEKRAYELSSFRSVPPGQSETMRGVELILDRVGSVRIPTGTDVAPVLTLVEAVARANAGGPGVAAQVSAFVGSGHGQVSVEEAQVLADRARAAMQTGTVDDKINAAAQLLLGGRYQEAIDAYLAIAQAHPEYTGTCYGQVGAALFFMRHYGRAIEYYQAAKSYGADPGMMDDNIREAQGYL